MIDDQDGIFIGGSTSSVGDLYLAKYSTSGDKMWMKTYPTNDFEYGMQMTLGDDGYLYMGARTALRDKNKEYLDPRVEELCIRKIDKNGAQKWLTHYGNSEIQETLRAITTDKEGNIYTAHDALYNKSANALEHKTYLTQFNASGKQLETKFYPFYSEVTNIFSTSNHDLFLTGAHSIKLNENNTFGTSNVFFILKLKEAVVNIEG